MVYHEEVFFCKQRVVSLLRYTLGESRPNSHPFCRVRATSHSLVPSSYIAPSLGNRLLQPLGFTFSAVFATIRGIWSCCSLQVLQNSTSGECSATERSFSRVSKCLPQLLIGASCESVFFAQSLRGIQLQPVALLLLRSLCHGP